MASKSQNVWQFVLYYGMSKFVLSSLSEVNIFEELMLVGVAPEEKWHLAAFTHDYLIQAAWFVKRVQISLYLLS